MVAEQQGQVEALIARATAALEAEEARVEQVRIQLEADVIEPARADMEKGINEAKGRAATILEEGRATVKALDEMIDRVERRGHLGARHLLDAEAAGDHAAAGEHRGHGEGRQDHHAPAEPGRAGCEACSEVTRRARPSAWWRS